MGFRAKYFGPNDLASGASLMRAEEVITSFNAEMPSNDISDVIEYYNIIQLFDKKLYLLSWSEEAVDQYSATVKHF